MSRKDWERRCLKLEGSAVTLYHRQYWTRWSKGLIQDRVTLYSCMTAVSKPWTAAFLNRHPWRNCSTGDSLISVLLIFPKRWARQPLAHSGDSACLAAGFPGRCNWWTQCLGKIGSRESKIPHGTVSLIMCGRDFPAGQSLESPEACNIHEGL